MRNDQGLHNYLVNRQKPTRLPPPQVISVDDEHSSEVHVVFASSGKYVPWSVTYVNCPERYLMRYSTGPVVYHNGARFQVREDGDFRVVWVEEDN